MATTTGTVWTAFYNPERIVKRQRPGVNLIDRNVDVHVARVVMDHAYTLNPVPTRKKVLYMRSGSSSMLPAYETTTMFMVPRASGCDGGAFFDLVYEPGGYRACRRGNKR